MSEEQIENVSRVRRELAEQLRFFDTNVWLGRPAGFPLAKELAGADLGNILQKYYITGALVSHWWGKTVSPQDGNRALHEIVPHLGDNISAIWTGLPLWPAESGLLPGAEMDDGNVAGVRIFPKSHHFPLAGWCIGSLCRWLVERRLPLHIWHVELDWPELYVLAKEFPNLTIIVETQTQKILYHTRPLFALMRDCGNVMVELSNFVGPGFVEYAVRTFGAERFIFGSFLPMNDPFVAIGLILDADISDSDKIRIAGENTRDLVREVRK